MAVVSFPEPECIPNQEKRQTNERFFFFKNKPNSLPTMRFHAILGCLVSLLTCAMAEIDIPTFVNITALTARNNVSVLECWQLASELSAATIPGRIGTYALPIGNVSNSVYGVIPPRYSGGLHNAPKKQYVPPPQTTTTPRPFASTLASRQGQGINTDI